MFTRSLRRDKTDNRQGGFRQGGFTLIEAIMAALVTTLILAGVYETFRTAQRSVTEAQASSDLNQLGRGLLSDITRELNNCYPFIDNSNPKAERRFLFEPVDDVDHRTGLDSDSLEFVTSSNVAGADGKPSSDLMKVRYAVNLRSRSQDIGLMKFIDPHPGLSPEKTAPEPALVVNEVRSLNFRYWDATSHQWIDRWEKRDALPPAVEVTLGLVIDPNTPPGEEQRGKMAFVTAAVDLPMSHTPLPQPTGEEKNEKQ